MRAFLIKTILKSAITFFILLISLFFIIQKLENNLENKLINLSIQNGIETAKKAEFVINNTKSFNSRNRLLHLLINDKIKYIYALKYKNNKFRYIADGSDINERALYLQPFFPINKNLWNKAIKTKNIVYSVNKKVHGVWMTLLYPTKKYIIAMDISLKEYEIIKNILAVVKKYIIILSFIVIVIFISLIYIYYKLYKQQIKSFTDNLTQTYNRHFLPLIEKKLKNNYVLAMFDIDNFKKINDTYGHDVGDIVLYNLAKIIKSQIRNNDYLIRFGGEEFILILTNISKENAIKKINDIYKKLNDNPIRMDNLNLYITISGGLHLEPYREKNIHEALKKADGELYRAKKDGKNRFYIYNEKHTKLFLYTDIVEAIDNGNILVYLQPIYNIYTKKIDKFEALARIKFNDQIYTPAHFLEQIINTNYYRKFTSIVLNEVFNIIKKYKININVNFYIHDFFDEKFLNMIEEIKNQNKDYLNYLTIELLENQLVKNMDQLNTKLQQLKTKNISIAIDDFGSEYNNLNYLVDLDIDYIKIDASINKNIKNLKNQFIVQSIISLAKNLNIKTVAEYVEDEESFNILKNLQVDYIQGYYISKPLSVEEIKKNYL